MTRIDGKGFFFPARRYKFFKVVSSPMLFSVSSFSLRVFYIRKSFRHSFHYYTRSGWAYIYVCVCIIRAVHFAIRFSIPDTRSLAIGSSIASAVNFQTLSPPVISNEPRWQGISCTPHLCDSRNSDHSGIRSLLLEFSRRFHYQLEQRLAVVMRRI